MKTTTPIPSEIHVVNPSCEPLRSFDRPKFGSRYFGRSETSFSKGRRVVQPTYDDFYEQQGSSTNITNSFLGVVVAILTTNVSGKDLLIYSLACFSFWLFLLYLFHADVLSHRLFHPLLLHIMGSNSF
jgi:hypothetical protein